VIRHVLEDVVDDGLIETNPCTKKAKVPKREDAEAPGSRSRKSRSTILDDPELSEKQRSAFGFAIYAGPREGEQRALRWEDLRL
jgi:hypothetical protein